MAWAVRRFFGMVGAELLLLFGLILLFNNFLGNPARRITSDGEGYYDYLPSLFIHKDFVRNSETELAAPELYARVSSFRFYKRQGEFRVNKYPCGTALLQAPFFAAALPFAELDGRPEDGYQAPFQQAIFVATLFYLLLGLLFLKGLLRLYEVDKIRILACQFLLVFGTPIVHYANYEAAFSHVYSFAAVTALLFFAKRFFQKQERKKNFLVAAGLLGLVFILRPPNLLILFFLPFLAGSVERLQEGWNWLRQEWKVVLSGAGVALLLPCLQFLLWYLQTGKFLIYSYPGEGFDFLDPHFLDILFSYRKGLFVYTPLMLIACGGLMLFLLQRNFYLMLSWFGFFCLTTYVLSSWWSWFYGDSFGLRAYLDFFATFMILLALLFRDLKRPFQFALLALCLLTIPLNIVQAYQYKSFILHWKHMDKAKYWRVFLKMDKRYQGWLWRKEMDPERFELLGERVLPNASVQAENEVELLRISMDSLPDLARLRYARMELGNSFEEGAAGSLVLRIEREGELQHRQQAYLLHFFDPAKPEESRAVFDFELPAASNERGNVLIIRAEGAERGMDLREMRLGFYGEQNVVK